MLSGAQFEPLFLRGAFGNLPFSPVESNPSVSFSPFVKQLPQHPVTPLRHELVYSGVGGKGEYRAVGCVDVDDVAYDSWIELRVILRGAEGIKRSEVKLDRVVGVRVMRQAMI